MNAPPSEVNPQWYYQSLQYLTRCIGQIHQVLDRHITQLQNPDLALPDTPLIYLDAPPSEMEEPLPAFEQLSQVFQLSPFERKVLLLCVARTLHPQVPALCGHAQGDANLTYPTFQLAIALFPDFHWEALHPQRPLRLWNLLILAENEDLTHTKLEIDESILHYLLGQVYQDQDLAPLLEPLTPPTPSLSASHEKIVELGISALLTSHPVQLCGWNVEDKRAICQNIGEYFQMPVQVLSSRHLPSDPKELKHLVFRWRRVMLLSPTLLLLEYEPTQGTELVQQAILTDFIRDLKTPVMISTSIRFSSAHLPLLTFDVPKLSYYEQLHLWQTHLGEATEELNGHLEVITSQFNLPSTTIKAACSTLEIEPKEGDSVGDRLWQFCRLQARPRLEDLAVRIETKATWDDLILPRQHKQTLYQMVAHLRQRVRVYEDWGFAGNERRGLGISALFSGQSGTGKTLAAGIIARELKLDLYRIDLSSVVSKYIGETEKNLKQVFQAAETGGAILLFDEADALFGKRSEVQDSRDRYANMEVSYLLQSIEAYQGLCVLTTNLKGAIDQAFLRRIRFIVQFPFPDRDSREAIWKRIFPTKTPTEGLDSRKLSNLNVAGGNIRNIALNAAFLAADADEPVSMKHLYEATKSEYIKLERLLTEKETKGWNS